MPKRLQVILEDEEHRRIQRVARRHRMTLSDWVRQALRAAARDEPTGSVARKLAVVRAAATHAHPSGDVEQLLEEIGAGYSSKSPH